jgi:hypothetical protein
MGAMTEGHKPKINKKILDITDEEFDVLLEIAKKELQKKKEQSIESLIEFAKETKRVAKQLYPKDRVEVYVDEDKKQVNINFPDSDSFWNNVKIAKVIIETHIDKKTSDTINKRIYV